MFVHTRNAGIVTLVLAQCMVFNLTEGKFVKCKIKKCSVKSSTVKNTTRKNEYILTVCTHSGWIIVSHRHLD